MLKYIIQGPVRLKGEVSVSGSKNSILALMAGALLSNDEVVLDNIPKLKDIDTMAKVLEIIGAKVKREGNSLVIDPRTCSNFEAPYDLVSTMRASIYVLGPLLSKYGEVKVSMPGGCAWGPRPIDFHIEAMKQLGADISVEHGDIVAKSKKLKGKKIFFDTVSVGATVNVIMAAALAEGETIIENAAAEPEVVDLANFLKKMGADITGEGSSRVVIKGVSRLSGCRYAAIPDRIEAGTFLTAAAMTKGDVLVKNLNVAHLEIVIQRLMDAGAKVDVIDNKQIRVRGEKEILPIDILTAPFPGFATDMQAQFMAMLSVAKGTSTITEGIYHDRFMHALELGRMGADITIKGSLAVIKGTSKLTGARVMASDLRASAALVLAGLLAEGETTVSRIYHIERGYENFDKKLNLLGAKIEKVD